MAHPQDHRLDGRLGLNVPYEWWPSAAALKAIEAAGFKWVQVASPPVAMLADPRHAVRHAAALRRALEVTDLKVVVHGPTNLQVGSALHDRAFEGLLEYAYGIRAALVVYHALDFDRRGLHSAQEEQALRKLGHLAEAMRLLVCLENLCPVYPGRSSVCHDPLSVRDLVKRLDSPAYGMLFDIGHAHVVAGFMGVETQTLLEPVLDAVRLFHVHDNLGPRLWGEGRPSLDPLQLDLHLPPGGGTLPWDEVSSFLLAHDAPLMMEIHPAHRPLPSSLWEAAVTALTPSRAPAPRALVTPASAPDAGTASVPGARDPSRARHSASR
jgi:sugar phosphate isomerase/epimerase